MTIGYKTGGRKAGTPNKATKDLRDLLTYSMRPHLDRIPEYLDDMEPEQRLHLITKLLPFILSKVKDYPFEDFDSKITVTMDLTGNGNKPDSEKIQHLKD